MGKDVCSFFFRYHSTRKNEVLHFFFQNQAQSALMSIFVTRQKQAIMAYLDLLVDSNFMIDQKYVTNYLKHHNVFGHVFNMYALQPKMLEAPPTPPPSEE
eukprot:GHVH01012558.1.p1 GENE.GHVH01012558.1~~GHVH01012558.1.p1  ORF type:complete len:100 (-),score=13.21 GHVH01012558.1:785-1084(-)